MRKNWIATEEHSDEVQDVSLMEVPSESLESDLVEVTGLDKDVESLVADGEELEHDQDQVEALADNAEASLEEDGMDETAARATEIAAEAFCGKWGVQRKKVGLESFGTSDGRRQATQIAVESLKDAAVNMWETFVKWIKELVAKAKEQLLKLTNAGKKIKSRAEKLEARLDKGLGELDKKEVEGSFLQSLTINDQVDYSGCLEFADKNAASVDKIGQAIVSSISETGKITRDGNYTSETGQSRELIGAEFGKQAKKKLTAPQGASDLKTTALPGNAYLLSYKVEGIQTLKFEVANDKVKDAKLPTLKLDECKAGVKSLFTIGEVLETKLKAFRDANEAMGKLADELGKAKGDLKEADSEKRDGAKKALKVARANIGNAKAAERAVTTSMKNAGAGIAGYVAASIAAYKAA